ncbi:MAG: glycoside hydrolase family 99-like domain-containing protein [Bauldia sp.]|nr:glycoside hydrolase family 99-like domain-containing protein [Bauldia sp.]
MGVDPFSAAFGGPKGRERAAARQAPAQATPLVTPDPRPAELDQARLEILVETGLFDPDWYRRRYRDLPADLLPERHFLEVGAAEDRWPNPHFDPGWYRQTQLAGHWPSHPVLHYLETGERNGLRPAPYFDPAWYAKRYLGPFQDISPLGHYLRGRATGRLDPCPMFDTQYYIHENADVVAAGLDPFEHFLETGHREGRNPSAGFDLRYYRRRYMNGAEGNPLLHYLDVGMRSGFNPDPAAEVSAGSEVRRFARKAPEYEDFAPDIVGDREKLAKLIAFYLPQFHAFPENDAWWGKGFTEWTNLSRGNPRFVGHYQPRVPRDLGFYDLKDPEVMRKQIAMARAGGLHGFCFYYYNFNGQRLLHAPVEDFLASDADWPFCIMWANENWSRRWDGSESQILIRQDYRGEDEAALVDDLARHFADPRYIRVGGRPLFFLYRPEIVPRARETIASWRKTFRERHRMEPLIYLTQTFNDHDPTVYGMDGAIEFPPHKILAKTHQINPRLEILDHGFSGHVYQYEDVVRASEAVPVPDFPLIKTVFPSWDNDARRQGTGVIATGSTPAKYRQWLDGAIRHARRHPIGGEPLVFINAWNEWAEGAYLEPDIHFGSAYLNATARAVVGERVDAGAYPVLVVVSSSAPAPTLAAARDFAASAGDAGCEVHFVRIDRGGNLREEAPVARSPLVRFDLIRSTAEDLRRKGLAAAFVFGGSAGDAVIPLREAKVRTVSFITEMPLAITARGETDLATTLVRLSDVLVAPSAAVLLAMADRFGPAVAHRLVRPPVPRRVAVAGTKARARAATALGLRPGTRLVVNVGPANLQNGADLFATIAGLVTARRDDVAFVWLGELDPVLRAWLAPGAPGGAIQFRPASDLADPLAVAEMLAFTAREDATAPAAATAIASGVAVVAFDDSGAVEDIVSSSADGTLVARGDVAAFADEVVRRLDRGRGLVRAARPQPAGNDAGVLDLVREGDPSVLPVSIVMTKARGDADAAGRLAALLGQTRPAGEVVVLAEDLSAADRDALRLTAARAGRPIRIVEERLGRLTLAELLARAATVATQEFAWVVPAGEVHADLLAELSGALVEPKAIASVRLPARRGQRPAVPRGLRSARQLEAEPDLDEALGGIGAILWRRRPLLDALGALPALAGDSAAAILRQVAAHSGVPVAIGPPAAVAAPVDAATSPRRRAGGGKAPKPRERKRDRTRGETRGGRRAKR